MSHTYSSNNSVNNQFYHEILRWTCILGSSKCKDHVNRILKWHFQHPAQNKLLPSWQKWIYCQKLMLETVTFNMSASWQTILNIYQTQGKKEEFFELLPCSRQYENLYGFLFYLDKNYLPIPESSLNARKIRDTVLKKEMFDFNKHLVGRFPHTRERRYVPTLLLPLLYYKDNSTSKSKYTRILTAETSDTESDIVNTKKRVTVRLLFNIFALHSKNNSALDIILFGLEKGIGRDVCYRDNFICYKRTILAIINCIINNIYSDDGLAMINQQFLGNLMSTHEMDLFAIDAIREKINSRRSFLGKMQDTLLYKPQDIFNYQNMAK